MYKSPPPSAMGLGAPGAPTPASRVAARVMGNEAAAAAAAAGAGAGAASPEDRARLLEEFMKNNRYLYDKYTEELKKFGIESRDVAAAIAAAGDEMDAAKMKKVQIQNEIMSAGMTALSAPGTTDKEKVDILRKIDADLKKLDGAVEGGRRRRRRGLGSKTTKRRNHRNRRQRKNTRRHR